jgi:hypothetical protein
MKFVLPVLVHYQIQSRPVRNHKRARVGVVALFSYLQGRQVPCEGLSLRIAGVASQVMQLYCH